MLAFLRVSNLSAFARSPGSLCALCAPPRLSQFSPWRRRDFLEKLFAWFTNVACRIELRVTTRWGGLGKTTGSKATRIVAAEAKKWRNEDIIRMSVTNTSERAIQSVHGDARAALGWGEHRSPFLWIVQHWERGAGGDAAHVGSDGSHVKVSVHSPLGTPGVLDDPVMVVVVAHSKHGVVDGGRGLSAL